MAQIREIQCNGFKLKGFRTSLFPYEILIPHFNIFRYSAGYYEDFESFAKNVFNPENVRDKDFSFNGIMIDINCGSHKIFDHKIDFSSFNNKEEAIEVYKDIINNCLMISFWVDYDTCMINNIAIDYLIGEKEVARLFPLNYKRLIMRMEY